MSRRVANLLLVPILLAVSLVVAPRPSSAAAGVFFELDAFEYPFSPNGDGHRDFASGFYSLDQSAKVVLQVKRGSLVATIGLGVKAAGGHNVRWDGTDGDGHVLRQGEYGLRIVAREANGTVLRSGWVYGARIDTTIRPGDVLSDWPVVYPRADVIRDRVWIRYLAATANSAEWGKVRGRVVGAGGTVVARLRWDDAEYTCDFRTGKFLCGYAWAWSGRRHGKPLAAERYRVAVIANDEAGNRFRDGTWVRVSDEQLVATLQSVTVSAADSVQHPNYPPGCNGCGEDTTCGDVVAPGRFGTGSLSYRSLDTCTASYYESAAREYHEAMFAAAPAGGDYRVTAYGGPAVPGGPDQGTLLLAGDVRVPTGVDSADHETVSPWVRPAQPWRTAAESYWGFETLGHDAYDVAWYRLDVTTYRPVP